MKKMGILILMALIPFTTYGRYTTLKRGLTIYSEYYKNKKVEGTIIFFNGSGTSLNEWTHNKDFFQCAKQYGSLFLYDRSGIGKSSPDFNLTNHKPITGKLISDELLVLLKQNHIKPPYLLVAHSYGAIYAGYFALKYPNVVKGLVMVDPVPRNFHFSPQRMKRYAPAVTMAKGRTARDIYHNFGGETAEVAYQLLGFEASKKELTQLERINTNIPVIIISSTSMEKAHPLKEDWYNSQKQWINNNPKSKITKIKSGHFVQFDQPRAICEAIKFAL